MDYNIPHIRILSWGVHTFVVDRRMCVDERCNGFATHEGCTHFHTRMYISSVCAGGRWAALETWCSGNLRVGDARTFTVTFEDVYSNSLTERTGLEHNKLFVFHWFQMVFPRSLSETPNWPSDRHKRVRVRGWDPLLLYISLLTVIFSNLSNRICPRFPAHFWGLCTSRVISR
jgi:hypothetical protein